MNKKQLPSEEELGLAVNGVLSFLATQNQAELGWIYSETRHIKGYSGQVEVNQNIQKRVDHAVGGLAVVYIFAMLEEFIPRPLWKYAAEEHRKRMYAYLHIRNTVAHGFDGSRADRYRKQFDDTMETNPLQGIKYYDEASIELDPYVWTGLSKAIQNFLTSILQQVVNYGYDETDA
ncbi:hypothetical protein [Kangiella sp. HZ709]|uniref:hypothetical protein n=1 Tax=Kangiella sp. HZ709 TaxID=2666328 RepID=UPI0012B0FF21|nr:hypothetical protein [Kangiella sp. HZ709]MRX27923.1 hypothetical protein [Kangiella sp. HZ709]